MTDWRGAPCTHPAVNLSDLEPVDAAGKLDTPRARRIAAMLCGRCPVRAACLDEAHRLRDLGKPPQQLIWAGFFWPVSTAQDTRPTDLLSPAASPAHEKAAAA